MKKSISLRSPRALLALVVLGSATLSGCATVQNMSNTQKGAVIGATTGAAVGGVIGRSQGSTAIGAIAGAAVGGAAGAIIGRQMDRQAEQLKQNIPGAQVERVGEGIQVTFDSGLLFDFDSSVLRAEARSNLQALANSLHQYPDTELLIVGHTDAIGSAAYNQRLSEQRSASAANYLASQGVARSRLNAVGRGLHEPLAANDNEWGRQQNRRVEVAIYASEAYRQQVSGR